MKEKLKQIRQKLKTEANVYRRVMNHPKTPRSAKWLLGLLDDALIVPGLIYLALKQIPEEVMREIRDQQDKNYK